MDAQDNVIRPRGIPVELADGKTYRLIFNLNAWDALAAEYGSTKKALEALDEGDMKAVRFFLATGFHRAHPELTGEALGDLVDGENMGTVLTALKDSMSKDMGDKVALAPNPPAADQAAAEGPAETEPTQTI